MKNAARCLVTTVIAAMLLAFTAFAGEAKQEEAKKKEVKPVVATVGQDGVQRVEIKGGGYFYEPNYVIVKVNVPVELTLTKESGFTPHDFVIKAPEAGIVVSETLDTKPKMVKFTPTAVGKYPFYCSKKLPFAASHRDKGMEGVLEAQ